MFTIATDCARSLVTVRVSGFWTLDEAKRFMAEEQEAVRSLPCAPGGYRLLVDIRDAAIQSQEVVALLQHMSDGLPNRSSRIAFVTGAGLGRMQARRAIVGRGMALFADEAAALDYLMAA